MGVGKYAKDSHMAESYAAFQVVQFALEIGIRKIIFEGDALNVVNHIN